MVDFDQLEETRRRRAETPDKALGEPGPEGLVAAARAREQELLNTAHTVSTAMWSYDLLNVGEAGEAFDIATAPRDGFGRKRGREAVEGFERHRSHLDAYFTSTMRKAPDERTRQAIEGPLRRWHAQAMERAKAHHDAEAKAWEAHVLDDTIAQAEGLAVLHAGPDAAENATLREGVLAAQAAGRRKAIAQDLDDDAVLAQGDAAASNAHAAVIEGLIERGLGQTAQGYLARWQGEIAEPERARLTPLIDKAARKARVAARAEALTAGLDLAEEAAADNARKALKAEPGEDAAALRAELDHRIAVARHQRKEKVRALEDRAWSTILAGAPLPPHVFTTVPTETARVMEEAIRRRETGAEVPHDPLRWLAWRRWPDAAKRKKTFGELHTVFLPRLDRDHMDRLLDEWRTLRGEAPEGDPLERVDETDLHDAATRQAGLPPDADPTPDQAAHLARFETALRDRVLRLQRREERVLSPEEMDGLVRRMSTIQERPARGGAQWAGAFRAQGGDAAGGAGNEDPGQTPASAPRPGWEPGRGQTGRRAEPRGGSLMTEYGFGQAGDPNTMTPIQRRRAARETLRKRRREREAEGQGGTVNFQKGVAAGTAQVKASVAATLSTLQAQELEMATWLVAAMDHLDRGEEPPAMEGPHSQVEAEYRAMLDRYSRMDANQRVQYKSGMIARMEELGEDVALFLEKWRHYNDVVSENEGRIPRVSDIRDLEDFRDWLTHNIGEATPDAVMGVVSSLAGPVGIAGYGAGRVHGNTASHMLVQDVDPAEAGRAAVIAALPTTILGPAANYARNGLAGKVIEKIGGDLSRRLGVEVGADVIEKGLTSLGQSLIQSNAVSAETGEPLWTYDSLLNWLDEFASGAVTKIPGTVVETIRNAE